MEMPAVESTSQKPVLTGTDTSTVYWQQCSNLLCCLSIHEHFLRLQSFTWAPTSTSRAVTHHLFYSWIDLLCLLREYRLFNNRDYFYCTCLYPPSLVQWIRFIFLVCRQNTSVGDGRCLLASSIVFFHGTLSVGCRYLGGLPYTVLEFGEGYVAFTLQ
jgi:hypothetical protein